MNSTEALIVNFEEVRRRSLKIWKSLPEEFYNWKSDKNAESFIEVIRHVLECEQLFHERIISRGILSNYSSPWLGRPIKSLSDELYFATPFREKFLEFIATLSDSDLTSIQIVGKHNRRLGDYLLRAAYHEAIHAGQFLSNLRSLGIDRPDIWD